MSINSYLVEKFLKANQISALRTILAIKIGMDGKVHSSRISYLAAICGTSKQNILKLIDILCVKYHLLEKSGEWYFCVGNKRYHYLHHIEFGMDRSTIKFDWRFAGYKKESKTNLTKKQYESELQIQLLLKIRDLKKLRTYCYIALQEKIAFQYKKQQKTSKVSSPMIKSVTNGADEYVITSTFFSEVMNFGASTIRKHQNRALKQDYFSKIFRKKRQITVIAFTRSYQTFITGKSLKPEQVEKCKKLKKTCHFDYSQAILGTSSDIVALKETLGKSNCYSVYYCLFFKGQVVALLQETAPKLGFKCRAGKFHKKHFFTQPKSSEDYTSRSVRENKKKNKGVELPKSTFKSKLKEVRDSINISKSNL